jgi:hypothetical protein
MRTKEKRQMSKLFEGLENGDLGRLVKPVIEIDKYCSKMGEDKDIIVAALTVMSKAPAEDLEDFIEKSYDWVLDADLSASEDDDGNYIIFVELERKPNCVEQLHSLVSDILNLTGQKMKDWAFTYMKDKKEYPMDLLDKKLIKTSEKYLDKTEKDKSDKIKESSEMNALRAMAGVTVQKNKIVSPEILAIQIQAGIR